MYQAHKPTLTDRVIDIILDDNSKLNFIVRLFVVIAWLAIGTYFVAFLVGAN